jgi:hypothetical protein
MDNFGLVFDLSQSQSLFAEHDEKSISNGNNNIMYYEWSPASTHCETDFEVFEPADLHMISKRTK